MIQIFITFEQMMHFCISPTDRMPGPAQHQNYNTLFLKHIFSNPFMSTPFQDPIFPMARLLHCYPKELI